MPRNDVPDPTLQVYIRSWKDSNGDGIGDFAGLETTLEFIGSLGFRRIWISPPPFDSVNDDYGYDAKSYTEPNAQYGSWEDLRRVVHKAISLGIAIMADSVPCHTSNQHIDFIESSRSITDPKRDWYVWRDGIDGGPPNNWRSVFGGPAWTFDERTDQWYFHPFSSKQPARNAANPAVLEAFFDSVRLFYNMGIRDFRVDAVAHMFFDPHLRNEQPSGAPVDPASITAYYDEHDHTFTKHVEPDTSNFVAALAHRFPDVNFLLDTEGTNTELRRYLKHGADALCFDALLRMPPDASAIGRVFTEVVDIVKQGNGRLVFFGANHDFPPLAEAWSTDQGSSEHINRLAITVMAMAPGPVIIYQNELIGNLSGMGPWPEMTPDFLGREIRREPIAWTNEGGFTTGRPWIPMGDSAACNIEDQLADAGSALSLCKTLIELRTKMDPLNFDILPSPAGILAYQSGPVRVIINLTNQVVELSPELRKGFTDVCPGNRPCSEPPVIAPLTAAAGTVDQSYP